MKITASRLSEGNKVFPAEIQIEDSGLTVKIPGLFGGKSTYLDYSQIGSVSVDAPMVGYSTITFSASGSRVSAHGFTKDEVKKIKSAIERGKSAPKQSSSKPISQPRVIEVDPEEVARAIEKERAYNERKLEEQRQKHEMNMLEKNKYHEQLERLSSVEFNNSESTAANLTSLDTCLSIATGALTDKRTYCGLKGNLNSEKLAQAEKIFEMAVHKVKTGLQRLQGDSAQELYTKQYKDLLLGEEELKWDLLIKSKTPEEKFMKDGKYYFQLLNAKFFLPRKKAKALQAIKNLSI